MLQAQNQAAKLQEGFSFALLAKRKLIAQLIVIRKDL